MKIEEILFDNSDEYFLISKMIKISIGWKSGRMKQAFRQPYITNQVFSENKF
jgi:hypothetical protein